MNSRKVSELPYQQLQARQWDELVRTLSDMAFIEAKSVAGKIFELMMDF